MLAEFLIWIYNFNSIFSIFNLRHNLPGETKRNFMNKSMTYFLYSLLSLCCASLQAMDSDIIREFSQSSQLSSPDQSPEIGATPTLLSATYAYPYTTQRTPIQSACSPKAQTMEHVSPQPDTINSKQAQPPLDQQQRIRMVATLLSNERQQREAWKIARQQLPKSTMADRAKFLYTSKTVQSTSPCCFPCCITATILASPCIVGYVCCHWQSNPCDECCPSFSDDAH